jgi:hypothetical protein
MMSSRQFRHEAKNGRLVPIAVNGETVEGRIFRGEVGVYKYIEVKADGPIVIGKEAFVDDVIAFLSACISTNPNITQSVKNYLIDFVDAMDARAVARHGYSADAEEAALVWVNRAQE